MDRKIEKESTNMLLKKGFVLRRPLLGHKFRFALKLRGDVESFGVESARLVLSTVAAILLFALVIPHLFESYEGLEDKHNGAEIGGYKEILSTEERGRVSLSPSQLQQVLFNLEQLGFEAEDSTILNPNENVPQRSKPSPKS